MMLIRTRWLRVSRRGAFLFVFGAVFTLIGYSYLNIPAESKPLLKTYLRFALNIAPIEVYAWAWIVCGALALLGGIWHRLDALGFAAAVFMPTIWAIAYFVAEWKDHAPRAWVSGVLFGLIAAAIALVAGMSDPLDDVPRRGRWR